MRRKPSRKSGTAVSLFPFLAVLLCTMGALIVMLMLVINQARAHAEVEAHREQSTPTDLEAQKKRLQTQLEDHNWRGEVLQQQREQIREEMVSQRLQLAHLEEHIRELERRRELLLSQMQQLTRLGSGEQSDVGRMEQQLSQLQQALEAINQDLDAARREAAARPKSYAILPYRGPHGTSRRPIYIECTEAGIVLRPENVVLRPEDFDMLHADNPLSAALRTIREYQA
jgi:peptidoglycan hydrolase CwlO-like protein